MTAPRPRQRVLVHPPHPSHIASCSRTESAESPQETKADGRCKQELLRSTAPTMTTTTAAADLTMAALAHFARQRNVVCRAHLCAKHSVTILHTPVIGSSSADLWRASSVCTEKTIDGADPRIGGHALGASRAVRTAAGGKRRGVGLCSLRDAASSVCFCWLSSHRWDSGGIVLMPTTAELPWCGRNSRLLGPGFGLCVAAELVAGRLWQGEAGSEFPEIRK